MVYAITYDLRKLGQDYSFLYKKIKSLGETHHPLQNLWFLDSNKTLSEILDSLMEAIDQNDYIFCTKIFKDNYDAWMPKESHDWLKDRI